MNKAVIYDMDGVIIDSEPLWREALITIFNTLGLDFTEERCKITQGMRLPEVVAYWHDKSPWSGMRLKEVEIAILDEVTHLIISKGKPMEGLKESINYFKSKNYKIALASSSALSLINTVLKQLSLENDFEIINSAEHLNYGKPHPEIFIKTATQLNTKPTHCLVIEDSFNGIIAAKAALMNVIAIPDEEHQNDLRFSIADYQINHLSQIPKLDFG